MSAQHLILGSSLGLDASPSVAWTIDCPTRGVVIVDVAVGGVVSRMPLHWRAGDWSKPPLDVRLSPRGMLENIQIVLQDESVDMGEAAVPSEGMRGLPVFDVQGWPAGRYSDTRIEVEILRLARGELYAAIGDGRPEKSVLVGEGLSLVVDSAGRLVGILLGPLTAAEWQMVENSAPRK